MTEDISKENEVENEKAPSKGPQDPYRNAYRALLRELDVNHRGLALKLRQFLKEKDYERYRNL